MLLLIEHFLQRFCTTKKRSQLKLVPDVERVLEAYLWPGNVRELENLAERLSILCDGDEVRLDDLPAKILAQVGTVADLPPPRPRTNAIATPQNTAFAWPTISDLKDLHIGLKEFFDIAEERLLVEALGLADGIKNQAAEILGIKRTTLIEKLKKRNME